MATKLEQRVVTLEARKPASAECDNIVLHFISPVDMAVVKAFLIVGGKLVEQPADEKWGATQWPT